MPPGAESRYAAVAEGRIPAAAIPPFVAARCAGEDIEGLARPFS